MAQYKIVLDAGHGGRDPGAVGPSGVLEKDVNMAVVKFLAKELSSFAKTIMAREFDEFRDLWERSGPANSVGADLFVSVHCNSAADPKAHGTETYVYRFGGEAEQLARIVQRKVVATLGTTDRGVKEKSLHVCRETKMPAILVELAFVSNPEEEKMLAGQEIQKKVARAVAEGIAEYLGVDLQQANREANTMPGLKDITGHWAETDIREAAQLGLVVEQEEFRPDEKLTRAEAVALLMRLYRLLTKNGA